MTKLHSNSPARNDWNGELEFLLAALRGERIRQQDFPNDVLRILALAEWHRIPALLLENSAQWHDLPAEFESALRERARKIAATNLLLAEELKRILKTFESAGIAVIPYKGPALSELVYGTVGLRPAGDLDLLVDERDTARGLKALAELGYRGPFEFSRAERRIYENAEAGYECRHQEGFTADLHFRVVPRHYCVPLQMADLFERSRMASFCEMRIRALGPEDMLVVLALHAAKHSWERIIWLCDITRLIDGEPELDWDLVMDRAHNLRIERLLLLTLHLAAEHLGARVPLRICDSYQNDAKLAALARMVIRNWQSGTEQPQTQRWRVTLAMRERTRDKLGCALRYFTTPNVADAKFVALPTALAGFYPAVRGLRLMTEVVRSKIPHSRSDEPRNPVHVS